MTTDYISPISGREVRGTSQETWDNLDADALSKSRKKIFEVIARHGPICNTSIEAILNAPSNRVTPRTTELVRRGMVEEDHRGPSPFTGRKVIFWRVKQQEAAEK